MLWGCMPNDQIYKPKPISSVNRSDAKNILLLIGPEGDFSSSEKQQLQNVGAIPVTLSNNRLRVETASLIFIANALFHWSKEK